MFNIQSTAKMMMAFALVFAGAVSTNAPAGQHAVATMHSADVITNASAGLYAGVNIGNCEGQYEDGLTHNMELESKVRGLEKDVDDYKSAFESIQVAATDRHMELKKTAREGAAASKLSLDAALLKIAELEREVEERDVRAAKAEQDHAFAMESCKAQIYDLIFDSNEATKHNLKEVQSENQTSNHLGRDDRTQTFEEQLARPHTENNATDRIILELAFITNSSNMGVSNASSEIETNSATANDRRVLETKTSQANVTIEQPLNQMFANKTDLGSTICPIEPKSEDLFKAVEEPWGKGNEYPQSTQQWKMASEADWFPHNAQKEDCKNNIAPPGSEYVALHGTPCYRDFDFEETTAFSVPAFLYWENIFSTAISIQLLFIVRKIIAQL